MSLPFADRLNNVETSAIRELFKLLGKPGIISFAGGFPDSAMFDVAGIREASLSALEQDPGAALQYGATEGFGPLREQLAAFMQSKGVQALSPEQLIVTTGSQQALDLVVRQTIALQKVREHPLLQSRQAVAFTRDPQTAIPADA